MWASKNTVFVVVALLKNNIPLSVTHLPAYIFSRALPNLERQLFKDLFRCLELWSACSDSSDTEQNKNGPAQLEVTDGFMQQKIA